MANLKNGLLSSISPVIPTNARVKCLIFRHLIFFDTVFAQHLHNRGLFGIVNWCSEVLTNSALHLRKILNVFFPFFGKADVNLTCQHKASSAKGFLFSCCSASSEKSLCSVDYLILSHARWQTGRPALRVGHIDCHILPC